MLRSFFRVRMPPPDFNPKCSRRFLRLQAKGPHFGGESMPSLNSMKLPLGIRCSRCSHDMPQFSTVNYVRRAAHAKTCDGEPIVSYVFNCPKCEKSIMLREDPENSGYNLKYGATIIVEPKEPEHLGEMLEPELLRETLEPELLGEIVDGDETSDCNLKKSRKVPDEGGLDQETSYSALMRLKLSDPTSSDT